MKFNWRTTIRLSSAVIATVLIVVALALNMARALTPLIEHYHTHVENWASGWIGRPIKIEHIRVTWYGYEPALKLSNLRVLDKAKRPYLTLNHLTIGIDLWSSLVKRRWLPGRLKVDGLNLAIHQGPDDQWLIGHQLALPLSAQQGPQPAVRDMVEWLLTQADVQVNHINILLYGRDGFLVPMQDIRLSVANSHDNHHIVGTLHLAQAMPTKLRFVVDLRSSHIYSDQFSANVFVDAQHIVLAQWAKSHGIAKLLGGLKVSSGDGSIKFWGRWRQGKLQQGQVRWRIDHSALSSPTFKQPLMVRTMSANAMWKRADHGWQLSADHIKMNVNHQRWYDNQLVLGYQDADDHMPATWQLAVGYLRLPDLQYVLSGLTQAPSGWQQWVLGLHPQGSLHHTMLAWQRDQTGKIQPLRLVTSFHHLQWRAYRQVPSVRELSGHVDWQPSRGHLMIDSPDLQVNTSHWLLRHQLNFKQAELAMHWRNTKRGMFITVQDMRLNDGNVSVHMSPSDINRYTDQRWQLNVSAAFKMNRVNLFSSYLPKRKVPAKLQQWLRQAFLAGRLQHGHFTFKGPLKAFPYDQHQGDFHITMEMQDLSFRFNPSWPLIEHADGVLDFHDRQMTLLVPKAITAGASLTRVKATIKNLANSDLVVTGHYQGSLQQGQHYVLASPLPMAKALQGMKVSGNINGDLRLNIPIKHDTAVDVQGHLAIQQGSVSMPDWLTALNQINGRFSFTQHGCKASGVTARYLQRPVDVAVSTLHRQNQIDTVQVSVGGQVAIDELIKHYQLPTLPMLHGVTDYRLLLRLYPFAAKHSNTLSLISDLRGLQVDLPGSFAKSADSARQLYARISLNEKQPLVIRAQYGKQLSTDLQYRYNGAVLSFDRGEVRIGKKAATLPKLKGLLVSVDLPYVNLKDWQQVYKKFMVNHRESMHQSIEPRLVDIHLTKVIAANMLWDDLHLRAQPVQAGWFIALKSQQAEGQINLPSDWKHQSTKAEFVHFDYAPLLPQKGQNFEPEEIPAMSVLVNDLRYKHRPLGHTELTLQPVGHGVKLTSLKIKSDNINADIKGEWVRKATGLQVESAGSLKVNDWGRLLREWQITDALAGANGMIGFHLKWPGRLVDFKMATASGQVNVALQDGRIMKLSEETQNELGLGRFLNILSMQSLPRRLVLNFGDLNAKGFEFDDVHGSFTIKHSKAVTQDMELEGPLADIDMRGAIQLEKKQYDLSIDVKPKVTGSLPFIATVTGGPFAGAITWVVNKLVVSRTIARAAMVKYHVSGGWRDPKVTKVG